MHNRIKRIILLAQALARGSATETPKNFSKIIVVLTGKLGDVVCCTPVLAAIRKYKPEVKIIAAGNSKLHKALLAESGLVDQYLDLDTNRRIEAIRQIKADAALVTGPSFTYTAALCAAGVPLVVAPSVVGGYSPSETRPYKLLKKFIKTYPYGIFEYAPRERLRALEIIGITTDDTTKRLAFTSQAERNVQKFFEESEIRLGQDFVVAISPTAGNKIKEWPEERFAKVAEHVIEKHNARVVLLGGANDADRISVVKSFLKPDTNVVVATQFNIDELKAFMSQINLFIAVDTGPIYVAEAFGTPTVDIVGPVDERVQPPRGNIHRNVVPKREKAELFILNARAYNEAEAIRQTLSISVEDVAKVVDELIADIRK
ncbi:MAG TPA: glycosyltransferase family 9 protein [Candidatus Nanoarchaeia archaeon]|nr:glycosyltransferase family 9 protein [Candidatus Nanoarchaeia archaeon]